jgi:hypothetical protein
MILCPKCKELASYNSYFARYFCNHCGWASESDRVHQVKIQEVSETREDKKPSLILK